MTLLMSLSSLQVRDPQALVPKARDLDQTERVG